MAKKIKKPKEPTQTYEFLTVNGSVTETHEMTAWEADKYAREEGFVGRYRTAPERPKKRQG